MNQMRTYQFKKIFGSAELGEKMENVNIVRMTDQASLDRNEHLYEVVMLKEMPFINPADCRNKKYAESNEAT